MRDGVEPVRSVAEWLGVGRGACRRGASALLLVLVASCEPGAENRSEWQVGGAPAAIPAAIGLEPTSVPSPPMPDFAAIVAGVRPRGFGAVPYELRQPAPGARTIYVSPSGADDADGTAAQPLRSIARAARVAGAGDVVTIRPGTYDEDVRVESSGTPERRIVFQAERRGSVVLTGGHHTFQPRFWTGGAETRGQWYVTVRGLIFRQYSDSLSQQNAIAAVRASRGWVIEDDLFDDAGKTGLEIRDSDVLVERCTFRRNFVNALVAWGKATGAESARDPRFQPISGIVVRDVIIAENNTTATPLTGDVAEYVVKFTGTRGTLVDNVESYANNGNGIWFDKRNVDYVVRNSYLHDNRPVAGVSTRGRGLFLEVGWPTGLVENDVFVDNSSAGITVANSAGVEIRNNLFQRNAQCVAFINASRGTNADGAPRYPTADVTVHHNRCERWTGSAAVATVGGTFPPSPVALRIAFDANTYLVGRASVLADWAHVGPLATLDEVRRRLGWERNGSMTTQGRAATPARPPARRRASRPAARTSAAAPA